MDMTTLDSQRDAFARQRFLAMPLAGAIVWTMIGIAGALLEDMPAALALFIGTGSIVYLGMFLSKFTGEDFLDKQKPKNTFDGLFMLTVVQALLVFSIAIPFFMILPSSLPLSVGVLTGLMWVPISWIIRHWVGLFHGLTRTALIVAAWYVFPDHRFVTIPVVIVVIYGVTIAVLEHRWRSLQTSS